MSRQDLEPSQYYQEDFLASHSVQPGSEEARTMTVTSGRKCCELYRKSGPLGSLVRTLLVSSAWHSTRCYLTWKASATPDRRLLFRLVPSTPRIEGIDVQLWRTPNVTDAVGRWTYATYEAYQNRISNGHQVSLSNQVKFPEMFPTPTARDSKGANSMEHLATGNHIAQLANMVKLFPTPTTGAGMCGGTGNYQQLKDLESVGAISAEERRSMAEGNGGQLNPTWVEWLMGFPLGWTDLSASETPSCHSSSTPSSGQ